MLCSYPSGNPFYRVTLIKPPSSQSICCLVIFSLLVGSLHGISASKTGQSVATHSNFFRSAFRGRQRVSWCANDPTMCSDQAKSSVFQGRQRVSWCANDPTMCSDQAKNPLGGSTCCFQRFCKDILSDPNNCGACGQVCAYRLVCCNGKCVDVGSDPQHCGACFEECPGQQSRCSYAMCDYGR